MIFECNSSAHKKIIDAHFTKGGLFDGFRKPDVLSTFTWNNPQNLANFLNQRILIRHSVLLVNNAHLNPLITEIDGLLRASKELNVETTTGQKVKDQNQAAYSAVWSLPDVEHSLVVVANSWLAVPITPTTECIKVFSDVSGCVEDLLNSIEYQLRDQTVISQNFLTLLSGIGLHHQDPVARMEKMVFEWDFEDIFGEDRQRSLVVQSVEIWAAEQQKTRLIQEIDGAHRIHVSQRKI